MKKLKQSLIVLMVGTPILMISFFVVYKNNDSSIFAIENISLVITIILMVIYIASFISIKVYEQKQRSK